MNQDAYNTIMELIKSNPEINYFAIQKDGKIILSTTEQLRPFEFSDIVSVIEHIEKM